MEKYFNRKEAEKMTVKENPVFESRVNIFEKFNKGNNLTNEEKDFISTVDAGTQNPDFYQAHSILANFYLAKQIEAASKSSDKSSKAMAWLTAVIALFTLCQVVIAIIK